MKIDMNAWTADRLKTEKQIRELKSEIRSGGLRAIKRWEGGKFVDAIVEFGPGCGSSEMHRALQNLKARATALYQLRALSRGRRHQLKEAGYTGAGEKYCLEVTEEQEREAIPRWAWSYTEYPLDLLRLADSA